MKQWRLHARCLRGVSRENAAPFTPLFTPYPPTRGPLNHIREFVRSGGNAVNDADLMALLRAGMTMEPMHDQRGWLRDVELALDAYDSGPQVAAAERVRTALATLAQGLSALGR